MTREQAKEMVDKVYDALSNKKISWEPISLEFNAHKGLNDELFFTVNDELFFTVKVTGEGDVLKYAISSKGLVSSG